MTTLDENTAKFQAEYAAGRAIYEREGVTFEGYCRTRRIDLGLEPLLPPQRKSERAIVAA